MLKVISREAVYLWYYFSVQLEQLLPYWVLGMVLGSAVSVFLKDRIHNTFRALGEKKLGVLGTAAASVLGIASPLCMYGTIPIAASFSKSGMKDDWLAAFMMSSEPAADSVQRRAGGDCPYRKDCNLFFVRRHCRTAGADFLSQKAIFQF